MNLKDLSENDVAAILTKLSYDDGLVDDPDEEFDHGEIDYSAIGELAYYAPHETPIGTVKEVDSYGGEGQGDQYWMIISIVQGDVIRTFKLDGWYASYDGGYYDEFYEVFPELKTITVWERK